MYHQNKHELAEPEITARYKRAQRLTEGSGLFPDKSKTIAFNTTLCPHWIGETDSFWYRRESKTGHTFRLVDANTPTNNLAFDHEQLGEALSQASGEAIEANNLPLTDLDFSQVPEKIVFTAFDQRWLFTSTDASCEPLFTIEDCKISPDGKQAVFYRDNNLWLRNIASGKERALTQDGEPTYRYATTAAVFGKASGPELVDALWSPDSKRVLTQVTDSRKVGVGAPEVVHVPEDGSVRPIIRNADRRVGMPCDDYIHEYRFLSIDVESGEIQYAEVEECIVPPLTYLGYFAALRGWWANDSRYAYFTEDERGTKAVRLRRFDTYTGKTEVIIEDTSDHYVTIIPHSTHIKALFIPLPDTNELIWFSERSGTAHFYLYDLAANELKKPITQGDWVARNSLHFDAARRELTFQSAGRVVGSNPYYCDICRVNIDTEEFTTVISGECEYTVLDQCSRISSEAPDPDGVRGVSPSANYIVTTRSRVDKVPVSLLLDRNGNELMVVETADVSGLPEDVTWPEPVMLKAADGVTDIYGVIFRPSDFDPKKSYPVLDCTVNYATPVGSFSNNNVPYLYLTRWAHAELGCIAVVIFNRGEERLRDRAFNEYKGPLPGAHNSDDSVAGIKQLAERFPYMDINRVGFVEFGHSPRALAGLLLYPDFYKVGVAVNASPDRRLRPAMGLDYRGKKMLQLVDLADKLEGKLLLIAGMLDHFQPVAQTFRMVEALQKAGKRFDMLILPNMGHIHTEYTRLRSWDYIVEHLLGIEPPKSLKGILDDE